MPWVDPRVCLDWGGERGGPDTSPNVPPRLSHGVLPAVPESLQVGPLPSVLADGHRDDEEELGKGPPPCHSADLGENCMVDNGRDRDKNRDVRLRGSSRGLNLGKHAPSSSPATRRSGGPAAWPPGGSA